MWVFCVTDGIHARCADAKSFDVIIISTPLEDEFGLDLAAELHGKSDAGLIVITKDPSVAFGSVGLIVGFKIRVVY